MNDQTNPQPMTTAERLQIRKENLERQIKAMQASLLKVTADLENLSAQDSITDGAEVTVKLGRAETTRYVAGTVLGKLTDDKGGVSFRVLVGKGIEAETVTVGASKVRLQDAVEKPESLAGELPPELPGIPGNELPTL